MTTFLAPAATQEATASEMEGGAISMWAGKTTGRPVMVLLEEGKGWKRMEI